MKTLYIYLDDIRNISKPYINADKIIIVRTYNDAISAINKYFSTFDNLVIDLDHDLGSNFTGYDFCKYLIEHQITGKFHIHSMNPVGVENMRQLLNHYNWKEI